MGRDEPALPVEDDGEGQPPRPVPQLAREIDDLHLGDQDWIADRHSGCRLATFIYRIDGDPHNLQAVRCKFLLDPHQPGDFLPARWAPTRPEVDHDNFPAPSLKCGTAPSKIGEINASKR